MASISVVFFAHLRETLGQADCTVELSNLDSWDTHGLIAYLTNTREDFKTYSESQAILVAVNQSLVSCNTKVEAGDVVALFPPVTGG